MKGRAIYGGYDATRGIISLNIGAVSPDEVQKWAEQKYLDVEIDVPGKKRSLSSNSYFHVLVSKIADALHTSDVEVKNRLIREYGAYMYVDGKIPTYAIKEELVEQMLKMDGIHWIVADAVPVEDGRIAMALKRGSHTYNSKEMSRLIEGTVEEAKTLGIEVLPPNEIKRMIEQMEARNGNKQ